MRVGRQKRSFCCKTEDQACRLLADPEARSNGIRACLANRVTYG